MTYPHREAMSVVPDPDDAAAAFGELENLLWRERGMLERMLYRLVAQAAVVSTGDWRWLQSSDEDVRDAIAPLQACEVARAAVSEELAGRYGLSGDVSLHALAGVAPDPWSVILNDHRAAIRQLEKDIRDVAAQTSQAVRAAFDVDDGEFGPRHAHATDRDGTS